MENSVTYVQIKYNVALDIPFIIIWKRIIFNKVAIPRNNTIMISVCALKAVCML